MFVFAAVSGDLPDKEKVLLLDENLLKKIGQGDQEAFCDLYEQVASVVFAYALSVLQNREDAEDAMQETFLKIRAAAHLYRPLGKPLAWIFTITKNICMLHFRQKRRQAVLRPDAVAEEIDFSLIEDSADRLVLETAFRILREDERCIVFLHALLELKHREIAALLRLPLSTVLSKYNRSIKKLRSEIERRLTIHE